LIFLFSKDLCSVKPKPQNLEAFIRAQLFDYHYTPSIASTYSWGGYEEPTPYA
jgi:hypothetical protein